MVSDLALEIVGDIAIVWLLSPKATKPPTSPPPLPRASTLACCGLCMRAVPPPLTPGPPHACCAALRRQAYE